MEHGRNPHTDGRIDRLYPIQPEQFKLSHVEPGYTLKTARERLRTTLLLAEDPGHSMEDYLSTADLRTIFQESIRGPLPRVYVIDTAKKQEVLQYWEECGIPLSQDISHHGGFYENTLDVAVVFRDSDDEERFGREYTASLIVHEAAHAIMSLNDKAIVVSLHPDGVGIEARTGFMAEKETAEHRNLFLEEAFTESHRLKYLYTIGKESPWMQQLMREAGVTNVAALSKRFFRTAKGGEYPVALSGVPDKGKPFASAIATQSAVAYGIFDTLAKETPELRPLLIYARGNIEYMRRLWLEIRLLIGNDALRRLRAATTVDELSALHKEIREILGSKTSTN